MFSLFVTWLVGFSSVDVCDDPVATCESIQLLQMKSGRKVRAILKSKASLLNTRDG